jgi:hypothetical protein
VDASATGVRAVPLPVLDNHGNVIPEDLIRATMQKKQPFWRVVLGALAGGMMFTVVSRPGPDCSIYDPCTPKEKHYKAYAPTVGLFVGALVGAAYATATVDREQAVKLLRERRGSPESKP